MANYGNKKCSTGKTIAIALCGVLSVCAVAGAGTALYMGAKNNGWFDKSDEVEDTEIDQTEDGTTSEDGGAEAQSDSEDIVYEYEVLEDD